MSSDEFRWNAMRLPVDYTNIPTILAWIWDFTPTSVVVYIMSYRIQIHIVEILYLVALIDPQLSLIVKLCI